MASEIRANKSTNRAGLGTVTYADTGIIVSGIVTCTELSGLTALNISGVGTASTLDINGDIDVDGHTNLDNVNIAGINTIGAVNQTVYSPHDSNWATRSALTLFGNYGGGLAFNDNNNNGWVQYVSGSGVDFWLKNGAVGGSLATSLKAEKGGSVELYENGTKVFETTSTGVDVTGTAGADALNVTGTSVVANLKSTNNNYVLGLAGNNSSVKSYFGTDSSGNFLLATGSGVDERLRITSSGTVGVNCTPTALPLEVKQLSADGGALRLRDSSAQYRYLEFDVTGALTQITARSNNSHGKINIGTLSQHGRRTCLFIDNVGDVGIGTDSPSYRLQVHHDNPGGLLRLLSSHEGDYDLRFVYQNSEANIWSYGSKDLTFGTRFSNKLHLVTSGPSKRLTIDGDLIGINETNPSNQLHIAGTTSTSAGGLLRLDATTGDNFIILDNTHDGSEWVFGNDSTTRDQFRMYYNGGSGYPGEPFVDLAAADGNVTIDGGTSTLVRIKGDSAGSAGLRLGGDSSQNQCTGYVEVHQDESHGGGFFYNGDGSPAFASSGETADYFSIHRLSSGARHSVMRWFHNSNDCEVQGNMLVDNGTSSTVYVRADNGGQAGVMCGGDNASGQTQSTGFFEAHQDDNYGGGFSYNGDGNPAFVSGETADHITFFRRDNNNRHRVFSYPYNGNNVNFAGNIEVQGSVFNYNSTNTMRGYFIGATSSQNATNGPLLAGTIHYGFGYQEAYSTSGGTWVHPYPDLVLGYHTGVSLGGHPNYGGCRFFGDHPSASSSLILSVGNGNNGVNVVNTFNAGTKNFRIAHPHPSKKYTHDLVHSAIEGPQVDLIYRGKIDLVGGAATVNIDTVSNMTDGTFVLLNRDVQCFTSNETGWTAVKGSVTGNILTITAQDNSCTDTISWMVVGERQDDKIKSVDSTDENGKLITEPLTIEETHM